MKCLLRKYFLVWLGSQLIVLSCLFTFEVQAQWVWKEPTQDKIIKRTVQWGYGGYIFTDELTFSINDYNYYKGLSKTQPYSSYTTDEARHPYLLQLAKVLDQDAKELGYTGYTLAAYLVAFVQQAIPYRSDPYNNGFDYPRYPIETIVDKGGDCEDKAALLVALLNTFGFDAILVNTPGHMAAAMACQNCGGYYNYNGKKYSFIEATEKGWQIGSVPPDQYVYATLLNVPRPPQYRRGGPERTVYTVPQEKGNGFFNSGSKRNNSSDRNTATIIINGTAYQIREGRSTTLTVNGSSVTIIIK